MCIFKAACVIMHKHVLYSKMMYTCCKCFLNCRSQLNKYTVHNHVFTFCCALILEAPLHSSGWKNLQLKIHLNTERFHMYTLGHHASCNNVTVEVSCGTCFPCNCCHFFLMTPTSPSRISQLFCQKCLILQRLFSKCNVLFLR